VRIALQAASLVLMARVLGANGYGALAGSVALFMVFGQFTGLGSGIALVRHVARGGEMRARFAATERIYFLSGTALTLLALPLSLGLLGSLVPAMALALLAIAEILAAPTLLPLVYRYQAEERLFLSSAIGTLAPVARLAAIASMAALGWSNVTSFAQLYLACLILTVVVTLYLTWPRGKAVATDTTRQAIREGLPYAVSGLALTAGSELDKTVLLRLAGEAVTGPYAAAYRIASAATLPVNALVLAASPRLFRSPSPDNTRLAATMLMVVLSYATLAAIALWLLAPFAPWLLGHGFDNAAPLLRAFCLIILTGSLRQYVTALLTTRDLQVSRNMIEIGGVCSTLIMLTILVLSFGAYGAVFAIAVSDTAVILASFILMTKKPTMRGTA
jgi:O-antigen/teichoic acid export membrane protein